MKLRFSDILKEAFLGPLLKFLSLLPLFWLRYIGSLVGIVGLKVSKKNAKRLKENLLNAGICTPENIDVVAQKTAIETGKTVVESLCITWQNSQAQIASLVVEAINFEAVEEASKLGKAILFITPHLGNFEIVASYTQKRLKKKFTVLYKPSKDKWFTRLMVEGRSRSGLTPVPTTRYGVLAMARALKNGEIAGILPDSVASESDGVWTNFFGKKVFATTLTAKLVKFDNVATFIVAPLRVKDGFIGNYVPFRTEETDTAKIVQEVYNELEKLILMAPTQYYWSYDRFRIPDHAKNVESKV